MYKGLSSDFPDTEDWEKINSEVIYEREYTDDQWGEDAASDLYRYLVEAVYESGRSAGTFSNAVFWDASTTVNDPVEFDGLFEIYPVPANDHFNIRFHKNHDRFSINTRNQVFLCTSLEQEACQG